MKKDCILLDVFTDIPFAGNQLAVFPSAGDLNSDQMQKLANEINYSETTFIFTSPDRYADFDIRIFTPRLELPFAGHPTLGTAHVLLNYLDTKLKNKNSIKLRTKVGIILLEKSYGNIWMRQNDPEFFKIFKDKHKIAELAGLMPDDILGDLPIEEVSTGNTILLIPIRNLSSIRKATGVVNKLTEFFANNKSIAPYLFTLDTEDKGSNVHTRFFAPHFGIIEDPATGSAAGPLTAYLLKYDVFGQKFEIQNEQGIEIGRPSKIMMRGSLDDGKFNIEIGGKCQMIGQSVFNI
ncbi:MAG: PhzF family phenazine biosynthesis protein [Candidatus Hodarchaeota archaeon]